jgi:hypothetical protein
MKTGPRPGPTIGSGPDRAPAIAVLESLTAAKLEGMDFADAWPTALRAGCAVADRLSKKEREDWVCVLTYQQLNWRDCYYDIGRRIPDIWGCLQAMLPEESDHRARFVLVA